MIEKLNKFNKKSAQLQLYISLVALFLLLLINTIEIVLRTFFNYSLIWIQDVSVLFMVWMVFLGFTKITYEKEDVLVSYFVDRIFKNSNKILVYAVTNLVVFIFLIVYTWYAFNLIKSQIGQGTIVVHIPLIYYSSAVFINAFSMIFIYLVNFIKLLDEYNNIKLGGQKAWQ